MMLLLILGSSRSGGPYIPGPRTDEWHQLGFEAKPNKGLDLH